MSRLFPVLVLSLAACNAPVTDEGTDTGSDTDAPGEFAFYTTAWADGEAIPSDYTCDGPGGWSAQDNPELVWENPPPGTQAFAVIYVDTSLGDWEHWAFYTDSADVLSIPRGTSNTSSLPAGVTELASQDGRTGYVPNCPGPSPHTYQFTIWAVSNASALTGQTTFSGLETAASSNSLGTLSFTGIATTN